jgi:Domain of unknown function (DUF1707)/Cell wall-active antibiotics response 4TMS YvqF
VSDLPAVPEPHELRASNADRERVARILHDAMAEGRITVTELEQRLDQVYAAKTVGELQPLTRDLPGAQAPSTAVVPHRPAGALDARIGGRGGSSAAIAVMSGATRKGPWTIPPTFNAVAFMGGVDIDLTEARFEDRETTIQAFALMGGINIVVPDDITVQVTGVGFMGAFEDSARVVGPEGAPVLKVTGFAMMGGVEVKRAKKKRVEQAKDHPRLEC